MSILNDPNIFPHSNGRVYRQSKIIPRRVVNQDLVARNDASTSLFTSTSPYHLDVDTNDFDKLLSAQIRYTTTVTQPLVMLPPELHFSEIVFRTGKGNHSEVSRWSGLALYWVQNGLRGDKARKWTNVRNKLEPCGTVSRASEQIDNHTQTHRLDLAPTWPVVSRLFGGALEKELRITLTPRSEIALRGTADGLSATADGETTNSALVLQTKYDQLRRDDRDRVLQSYSTQPYCDHILRPHELTHTQGTIAANTEFKITNLDELSGYCSFVLIGITSDRSTANFNNGRDELLGPYLELGDDATIELLSQRDEKILHKGTAHTVRYIRERMAEMLPGGYDNWLIKNNVYMIPFEDNPAAALYGKTDYVKRGTPLLLNSYQYKLAITPGAAGTASSFAVDDSGGVDATQGQFRLTYGGKHTNWMDHDAAVAVLNHELRLLLAPFGMHATADQGYAAGATTGGFTVTFNQHYEHYGNSMGIEWNGVQAAYAGGDVTWTRGARGYGGDATHSGNYTVNMYWFMYDKVTLHKGHARPEQLMPGVNF